MDTLTFSTIAIAGSVLTLWIVCLILDAPLADSRRAHGWRSSGSA
jgi:hypothetical protein